MPPIHEKPIPSKAAILSHPLHPIMVAFPTAFLIAVVATDALFWWRGDAFWAEFSFYLLVAGFGTGVIAAGLGSIDFLLVREVRRYVAGWSHLIAGVMTVALSGTNMALRWGDPVGAALPWGMITSVVTAMIVGAAGWFGGELTFRYGIGSYAGKGDQGASAE